jgi:hypothetical protein
MHSFIGQGHKYVFDEIPSQNPKPSQKKKLKPL